MTIQFVIKGNPKGKKNSMRIARTKNGKTFLIQPESYLEYAKNAHTQLAKQKLIQKIQYPIAQGINLKCVFYRSDKRRVDLANLLNAISDILVENEVIEDDNSTIIRSYDGSTVLYDKKNPRAEIEISVKEDAFMAVYSK